MNFFQMETTRVRNILEKSPFRKSCQYFTIDSALFRKSNTLNGDDVLVGHVCRCLERDRKSPTTTKRFGGNKIKTLIARFAVAAALDAKCGDAKKKPNENRSV